MSLENTLEPGERITYKARRRWVAYIYPLLLLGGAMIPGQFAGLVRTELMLTDKRLVGKAGSKRMALPYKDIAGAGTRQGLLGKLFDYGNIVVSGNDGSRIVFCGIAEPLDVKIQIDEAIEMAVLGRKLSQTAMAKW